MGNCHDGAFEIVQEAFQPGYGFRIQVVGRFVEQQHVRFFQQQTTQCHAAALAAGQFFDFGIPVRQTQGVSGALKLHIQVMTVVRLDNLFKPALFCRQLVEVGIRIGVQRVHFIQTFEGVNHFRNGLFNRLAYRVFRV